MKFNINVKAFADTMALVNRVVERRNTYPILGNVHLAAADGRLKVRATDLDIEITTSVDATVIKAGETTVPSHLLTDILRKLPKDAEASFELADKDTLAKLSVSRSRYQLNTLSVDSFPTLKVETYQSRFEVDASTLMKAFEKVEFAISNEETRYYLNGVYMHGIDKDGEVGLRFVATDGHRLARCFRAIEDAKTIPGIIVPKKTVSEIIRLCDLAGDGTVTVSTGFTRIRVEHGVTTLDSKLIEGTFPDYERVTPKDNNRFALSHARQITDAVDRVSTVSSDRGGKAVKFSLSDNLLKLEVNNPDHGTATDEVPIEYDAEGAVLDVGFNAAYFKDVMGAVGGGKVRLAFKDSGSPVVIKSEDDGTVLFVLMPMRV